MSAKFNPEWLNKPRKRGNPEARLLLSILKYLNAYGWHCGKVKTKGSFTSKGAFIKDRYQMIGLPDAFAFKDGCMLAIETKVGKNTLTPDQETFKQHFHSPPDRLFVEARSVEDIEKVVKSA